MREKIRKSGILKILLFAVLVLTMAALAEPVLRPEGVQSCYNAVEAFHSLPDNSIDVIAFGSSRVWRGINAKQLFDEFGLNAYNYGSNWQKLNTTELFIEDALRTQSPQIALVEVRNVARLTRNKEFSGELYATRALPWSRKKLSYLHWALRLEPVHIASYFFPVISIHNTWTDLLSPNWGESIVKTESLLENRGSLNDLDRVKPKTLGDHSKNIELNRASRVQLDRIVDMCKAKGTQVVFYLTPCTGQYSYSKAMKEYAMEKGCDYVDGFEYLDEIGIDPSTDFADKAHLNIAGEEKMTRFLGNYLREHYELP